MNTHSRLLEIADFLDNFEARKPADVKWDYTTYGMVCECGTHACALGAAALAGIAGLEARIVLVEDLVIEFGPVDAPCDKDNHLYAAASLGITEDQAFLAFNNAEEFFEDLDFGDVTPRHVATVLRHIAESYDAQG